MSKAAQIATGRLALGSVFGTVAAAAGTISSTMEAASSAVGMLNAYVDKAATEQKERYAVDALSARQTMLNQKAAELAANNDMVHRYRNQSEHHAQLFDEAYALLKTAFDKPKDNVISLQAAE